MYVCAFCLSNHPAIVLKCLLYYVSFQIHTIHIIITNIYNNSKQNYEFILTTFVDIICRLIGMIFTNYITI